MAPPWMRKPHGSGCHFRKHSGAHECHAHYNAMAPSWMIWNDLAAISKSTQEHMNVMHITVNGAILNKKAAWSGCHFRKHSRAHECHAYYGEWRHLEQESHMIWQPFYKCTLEHMDALHITAHDAILNEKATWSGGHFRKHSEAQECRVHYRAWRHLEWESHMIWQPF